MMVTDQIIIIDAENTIDNHNVGFWSRKAFQNFDQNINATKYIELDI